MNRGLSLTDDPELWKGAWWRAKKNSPVNQRFRFPAEDEIEDWNRRAQSYAQKTRDESSQSKRKKLIEWLDLAGAVKREFRALDIGAGPGYLAIALARRLSEVWALEPAKEMMKILKQRSAEARLSNIRFSDEKWEDLVPEREGWLDHFDLVIASMSPGLSNPEALQKMNSVSRRYCYLSAWSGPYWGHWGKAKDDLWREMFQEDLGDYPNDILYAIGLLYSEGYRPEIRFRLSESVVEEDSRKVMDQLVELFDQYTDMSPDKQRLIEQYVQRRSTGDVFSQSWTASQGFILWRVDQRAAR